MLSVARPNRLESVDGLRAISVSLVIASHLAGVSAVKFSGEGLIAEKLILPLIDELGRLGVYTFFVISGFVICRGLMAERKVSLAGFYRRRFFRIVPPLLLYVGVVAALMAAGVLPRDLSILRALTFTCNAVACGDWYGAHTWSLSVEEQFYLVMPLVFILARPAAAYLFPVVAAIYLTLTLLGSPAAYLAQSFVPISVGVLCALHEPRLRAAVTASPRWAFPLLVILSLVALRMSDTRLSAPATIVLALLLGGVVMVVAFGKAQWLAARPLVALGGVSYTIYLWQQVATAPYEGAGWLFYIFSVAACVGWAFLSYRWIEAPLISYGRGKTRIFAPDAAQVPGT
jgi:peptidoglycan/LPS O-acetylase OafA/YrhL